MGEPAEQPLNVIPKTYENHVEVQCIIDTALACAARLMIILLYKKSIRLDVSKAQLTAAALVRGTRFVSLSGLVLVVWLVVGSASAAPT